MDALIELIPMWTDEEILNELAKEDARSDGGDLGYRMELEAELARRNEE